MNKVLITGSSGFVGQQLCKELDVRTIPYNAAVRTSSAGAEATNRIVVGDISCKTDWSSALQGVQVVVHLAARVHVMNESSKDPLADFRAMNVDATLNLARQAVQAGARRFIFISSIKVNGERTLNQGKPFTSLDEPNPLDFYGQSKLEAELALQQLAKETGLELVIVRPPLVYGPAVKANFQKLMGLVKLGVPLPFAGVDNRRSMVALDNLVDLLITCLSHPSAANQVFLVSDDEDLSLVQLLKLIANEMDKKLYLFSFPLGFVNKAASLCGMSSIIDRLLGSLQVDIEHTKQVLNWKPIVDVKTAIGATVAHFLNSKK